MGRCMRNRILNVLIKFQRLLVLWFDPPPNRIWPPTGALNPLKKIFEFPVSSLRARATGINKGKNKMKITIYSSRGLVSF